MPAVRPQLVKRVYLPPYSAKGAATFAFVLSGDANSIRDKVIRPALGNNYRPLPSPLGGLFVIAWVKYDGFSSQSAPDSERGEFTFKESAIFLLVRDQANADYIYIPSLYLDTDSPELTGREVYGFPKSAGTVNLFQNWPPAVGQRLSTRSREVRNFATPPEFPQDSLIYEAWLENGPISFFKRTQSNLSQLDPFAFIDDALENTQGDFLESAGSQLTAAMNLLSTFLKFEKPLIFIKQMPSSAAPLLGRTTSLHEVKANFNLSAIPFIDTLNIFNVFKVRIMNWASAPIASSFGVPADTPLNPLAAVYAKVSYTMGHGTETPIV